MRKEGGRLPEYVILVTLQSICQAIHQLHTYGVIHGHIKTNNIFVRPNGEVKLGDYGISKVIPKAGEESLAAKQCSLSYTSPEKLKDNSHSDKCDIWALGCVIHEMCLMRKTFSLENQN